MASQPFSLEQGRLELYDVQMSALFVSESQSLQELAPAAGSSASAAVSVGLARTNLSSKDTRLGAEFVVSSHSCQC